MANDEPKEAANVPDPALLVEVMYELQKRQATRAKKEAA